MERSILISAMIIGLVAVTLSAGTIAYFNDTETSQGNTFTAGTLDLKVDDNDDPYVENIELSNIVPGWGKTYKWCLKNNGSIPGKVLVGFSAITNSEGAVTEPESDAEDDPYGYLGARATLGRTEGELGEYLKPNLMRGPCTWSCGSNHFGPGSVWATGPATSYGTWGLDSLGGNTYNAGITLGPGETIGIFLTLSLDLNLRAWDGCGWHDINDSIIQDDSVVFNIIFYLEQV